MNVAILLVFDIALVHYLHGGRSCFYALYRTLSFIFFSSDIRWGTLVLLLLYSDFTVSFLKMHPAISGRGALALCHLMPNKSHNLLSVYTAPPLELHDQLLCN